MSQIPFDFKTSGFAFLPIPDDYLHLTTNYDLHPATEHRVDDEGVHTYIATGHLAQNPVSVLVLTMARLWRFQREGNQADLKAAERQIARLMTMGTRRGNAVFYPYTFEWNLHRFQDAAMEVPWYSGMAQGYALMALVRLHRLTDNPMYLDEAQAVLESFLQIRSDDPVWVTDMLDEGFVWFEEYPRNNGPSDVTYNGHLYAVFGLYEYFMHTGDDRARLLADGGLTSILHLFPRWRAPGRFSWYCDTHREGSASYHASHCEELAYCYSITGHPLWIQLAEVFIHDWPATSLPDMHTGPLVVQPGLHEAVKTNGYDITERIEVELSDPLTADWSVRLNERTELRTYIRCADERYLHLLFAEEPGVAYVQGPVDELRWPHLLPLTPVASPPRFYRVENAQLVEGRIRVESDLQSLGRATINGMHAFRVRVDGSDDWWVPREDVEISPMRKTND